MIRINIYILSLMLLISSAPLMAQSQLSNGIRIENFSIKKYDKQVLLDMSLCLDELQIKSNEQVLIAPMLVKGADTLSLLPVKIVSKRQAIHLMRNTKKGEEAVEKLITHQNKSQQTVAYHQYFPYQEWMDGAQFSIYQDECKCNHVVANEFNGISKVNLVPPPFAPELAYIRPEATVKTREAKGTANLVFPQGKAYIDATLSNNTTELQKIWTVSSNIKELKKVVINNITFHGYASPEGRYASNARLAEQRVMAVKEYAQKRFNFSEALITVEHTPEDWTGLRKLVENSTLRHKLQILELIDSNREPDNKEWKIKSAYPKDYAHMLKDYYPLLRRTDYTISYTIGDYTVEEAKEALKSNPELLNLNEFYLVAQTYPIGSAEFTDVFEIAARLYPNDTLANLNAANAALNKGDLPMAIGYLAKAGDSGEAINARGVKAMLEGNLDEALSLLEEALRKGVAQAEENIKQIKYRTTNY